MHILKKIFFCVLAAMAGFPLFARQEQEHCHKILELLGVIAK